MEKQDLGIYLYTGALVAIFIGVSPMPGYIYNMEVPEMPAMVLPAMPELPEMPAMVLPAMPELPEMPAIVLPAMPELPEMSALKLPEMPQLPQLPSLPKLSLPELSLPGPPDLQLPSLPNFPEIPVSVTETVSVAMESVTQVCGDLGNKIAAWPVWYVFEVKDRDTSENTSLPIETKDEAALEAGITSEENNKAKESKITAEKAAASAVEILAAKYATSTETNNKEAEPAQDVAEEPTEDVNVVESLVKASQEIVVNIIEEVPTKSDDVVATNVVESLVKASEEIVVNIMESMETIDVSTVAEDVAEEPKKDVNMIESLVKASQEIVVNIIEEVPTKSDEPSLGDVENLDNEVATNVIESLVKASQDIVVNIMESNPEEETIEDSTVAVEKLPTNSDEPTLGDVENLDNAVATNVVESLVKASQDIVVNIIESTQENAPEAKTEASIGEGLGQRMGG